MLPKSGEQMAHERGSKALLEAMHATVTNIPHPPTTTTVPEEREAEVYAIKTMVAPVAEEEEVHWTAGAAAGVGEVKGA
jgi:hypothetical protein